MTHALAGNCDRAFADGYAEENLAVILTQRGIVNIRSQ